MKRRTFSDRELRDLSMKADIYDYQIVVDLARELLALQRALRNVTDPHRKADIAKDIEKARALLAPAREGKR